MLYVELGTFSPDWLGDVVAVVRITGDLLAEIDRTAVLCAQLEEQGSHVHGVRLSAWEVYYYRLDAIVDVDADDEDYEVGERLEFHEANPYVNVEQVGMELLTIEVSVDEVMWSSVPKGGSSRDYVDTRGVDIAQLRTAYAEACITHVDSRTRSNND